MGREYFYAVIWAAVFAAVFVDTIGLALEINDRLSIGGVLAGAGQYQRFNDRPGFKDTGRGAIAFQPEVAVTLTKTDELFAKFGFGAGNGLNDGTSPFVLPPWAADLEDDVKDINGRNRDYLLTAWYKHTFSLGENHILGITGGIIDATDYIDENVYANDEYTQFMNAALVNGPNGFAPSYDLGAAFEWEKQAFSLKGVWMNVGENDDANDYMFYGVQFGYALKTGLGEGNYRLIYEGTSKDFLDPAGIDRKVRHAVFVSFDQQLGKVVGGWIRFGFQDDSAAVDFQQLFSGGINITGTAWDRGQDTVGIGYAYLNRGNTGIDRSQVAEGYIRMGLNRFFALTLDIQYLDDRYEEVDDDDTDGWIGGVRLTVEF